MSEPLKQKVFPVVFKTFVRKDGTFIFLLVWGPNPSLLNRIGCIFPYESRDGRSFSRVPYSKPHRNDTSGIKNYIGFTRTTKLMAIEDSAIYAGLALISEKTGKPCIVCCCPFEEWSAVRNIPDRVLDNPEEFILYDVLWYYTNRRLIGNPRRIVNQACIEWDGENPISTLEEDPDLRWRKFENGKFVQCSRPKLFPNPSKALLKSPLVRKPE